MVSVDCIWTNNMGGWAVAWSDGPSGLLKQALGSVGGGRRPPLLSSQKGETKGAHHHPLSKILARPLPKSWICSFS